MMRRIDASKTVFMVLTIALILSTLSSPASALPLVQTKAPVTVADFYLLLPDKYVGIPKGQRQGIVSDGVSVVDLANGYLRFQESAESQTEIAIFKTADGSYVVGVNFYGSVLNKKTGDLDDITELNFLRYDRGQWQSVT